MKLSEKEVWQKQMVEAVMESGVPKEQDIQQLYLEILMEPDAPPKTEALWQLHSFIRQSLQRNLPLTWFVGDDLKQTLAPLQGIRKTFLHHSTHEVTLELVKQGKITVTAHPDFSADLLEHATREATMEMLVMLSKKLGMERSMRADEIKKIELSFQELEGTQVAAHATIWIRQGNQEETEFVF